MKHKLLTLRVYDVTPDTAGYRILVDRLWPRGLQKETLGPFVWAKEIAPTTELRKWFAHDPDRFAEFSVRYQKELDGNPGADAFAKQVERMLLEQDVLLLYAAKSVDANQAVVLKAWLERRLGP